MFQNKTNKCIQMYFVIHKNVYCFGLPINNFGYHNDEYQEMSELTAVSNTEVHV